MSEEAHYEHGDMWCPQCAVWWSGRVRCPACYFALVYRPRPGEPFSASGRSDEAHEVRVMDAKREMSKDDEEQLAKDVANFVTAKKAILARAKNERGVAGAMPCPVCGEGTLRYTVARLNGHVHAACTTKTCVRFME